MRSRAAELGFDACRIVRPDAIPDAPARLDAWLATGAHGDMGWMEETAARRADPRVLWQDVRCIVMLGMNYGPEEDPRALADEPDKGAISVYARHRDYHDLVKGRLKMLASWLVGEAKGEPGLELKVFVDTAPVMEKPLAAAAGLGWQGKHTNLVSRDFGSWLFLGSLFTTLDLPPDEAEADHCGSCRACLDACPTQAFPAPYQLDARRCISYLTIEHNGHIAPEFRAAIGNRIYGCDDCLAACPWNKFAQVAREAKLQARADLVSPDLDALAALDDAGFRAFFSGSPVKRIGHARFLRNLLIAIGNSGDLRFAPRILESLDQPDPRVRAMAVWAAGRVFDAQTCADLAAKYISETDADVQREWQSLIPKGACAT
ncbi:MAG: queG [Hyphomicrobiales bacterium]|nr:queG [Hyphomicrobiales bacterium]